MFYCAKCYLLWEVYFYNEFCAFCYQNKCKIKYRMSSLILNPWFNTFLISFYPEICFDLFDILDRAGYRGRMFEETQTRSVITIYCCMNSWLSELWSTCLVTWQYRIQKRLCSNFTRRFSHILDFPLRSSSCWSHHGVSHSLAVFLGSIQIKNICIFGCPSPTSLTNDLRLACSNSQEIILDKINPWLWDFRILYNHLWLVTNARCCRGRVKQSMSSPHPNKNCAKNSCRNSIVVLVVGSGGVVWGQVLILSSSYWLFICDRQHQDDTNCSIKYLHPAAKCQTWLLLPQHSNMFNNSTILVFSVMNRD